ncbi:MAG: methyltransferase domain-containing protein [Gemmatimonadetes bacterium]|nr:methyltransferase domain-containing protein [Gemmatimonadota bacterium]
MPHAHAPGEPHCCPWWLGYSFDNPLRRLVHDPARICAGLVQPGETVADIGCGLGYFTIGLARLVGERGRVLAIDVQPQMIARARRRAERRRLAERVTFRVCAPDRLGLAGPLDFALAFWMVHEVRDQAGLLAEVRAALGPGGRLLVVAPKLHVSDAALAATRERALAAGFAVRSGPAVRLSNSLLCTAGE